MNVLKAACVFALLAASSLSQGQENWTTSPFLPADNLPFEDVRSILETPDGALWFTSWGRGVARLKESEWRVFTTDDGMPSNFTRGLAPGADNDVWAATQGGIAYIDGAGHVTAFTASQSPLLQDPRMITAYRLKTGTILFGCESGRIIAYDDSRGGTPATKPMDSARWSVFRESPETRENPVWAILEARDGAIWVAHGIDGIARHAGGEWTYFPPKERYPFVQAKSLWQAPDGRLWAAGSDAPTFFDGTEWRPDPTYPGTPHMTDAVFVGGTPDGRIIAGTFRSGLCLRGENGWRSIHFRAVLGTPLVRTIFFDSRGRGWIGTKEGIVRFGPPAWENLTHTRGMVIREGHAFYASPEQPPLAVNGHGEFVQFDNGRWNVLASFPEKGNVANMTAPRDGAIWILLDSTVRQFSLTEQRVLQSLPAPSETMPRNLFQASDGTLYVYGQKGVRKLSDGAWTPCLPAGEPDNRSIRSMAEMRDGSLLVCSGLDLGVDIRVWKDGASASLLEQDEYTPENYLAFACLARDGRVWAGTLGSGIVVIDQHTRVDYRIEQGVQSNRIVCMRESVDGSIWLGAENSSISRFLDGRWTNFSHNDGLPNDIAAHIYEHPAGVMWVATRNYGVYRHIPDREPPRTIMAAYPESVPFRGAGVFSFSGYDAWSETHSDELDFSWRIVRPRNGSEVVPWSSFSRATTVATPRLPAGMYEFEVRASDKDRNIDPDAARAPFEVHAPLFLKPGFYIPFAVLVVLALGLIATLYVKAQALRRSQVEVSRLAHAVEQAAEIIVVTDPQGVIQYANPAFEQATGHACADVIGHTPRVLKSGRHSQEFYRQLWETISRGETWTGRFTNKKKGGTFYEEDASISPVRDAAGRIINYVAVKRDITEQVKLESQLRQAQRMEAVGQLAGGVAHDFNNLLQAIQGYTQLAMEGLGEEHEHYGDLREVMRAAEQAATLTRQLLSFSRREVLQRKNINLNQVIADTAKMLRRIIGEHIELHVSTTPDLRTVYADPAQMGQILVNLCVNARDAMPNGGRVTIATCNTSLNREYTETHSWAKVGEYVALAVSDTGMGINPDIQDRIFEPFFTTKEMGRGTGLGLATVYGIAKQHEGMIGVHSEPGIGTTFTLYLPAADSEAETDYMLTPVPMQKGTGTILLAEDEELVRNLGVQILIQAGYNVLVARDGEEAVAVFRRHANEIDVALLDVVMPKLSGRAVCERIQAIRPGLPVLFASGYSVSLLDATFLRAANALCIQKPYNPRDLLLKIKQLRRSAIAPGDSGHTPPPAS